MSIYAFPGYDDEPRSAESALQEWIDTQELNLTDEDAEQLYQFTRHDSDPAANIAAIQAGADYLGLDLAALGYPLPTLIATAADLDAATNGALDALAWSEYETDETGDMGAPLDSLGLDWDAASVAAMREELAAFLAANYTDLDGLDRSQIGHDFILTRNRHGAGFWDRGLGERGERLTEAAHAYGSITAFELGGALHAEEC